MKQNLKLRQPFIPEFFKKGYQICNPISSALLLTDAHHEVKRLIVLDYELSFTWTEQNFLSCWWTLFLFQPLLTPPYKNHLCLLHNPYPNHGLHFVIFAAAVIITLRTSAGSLRSKSFHPRSSRKLGREHNKEGGGEKGNACSETTQFRKMYTQLLIGAVMVGLIKDSD